MTAGGFRALPIFVAALLAAGPAPGAEPDRTAETYGDWTVRCVARAKLPPCDMLQVAIEAGSGREVLRLSLAHLGEKDRIGVQAWTPLGVMVSAGVLIRVDGKEAKLDGFGFTRCEAGGCFIEGIVGESGLDPFRRGKEGVLVVLDARGRPRGARVGFSGFTAALEAMKARNLEWWAARGKRPELRD